MTIRELLYTIGNVDDIDLDARVVVVNNATSGVHSVPEVSYTGNGLYLYVELDIQDLSRLG